MPGLHRPLFACRIFRQNLVGDAPQITLWRRKMLKGDIDHTDRGSQYCSMLYHFLLARYKLTCSMSAKGNC